MVNLSELEEVGRRGEAGRDKVNIIAHPLVLRKALMEVYYAEEVKHILKIIFSCDMKKPDLEIDKTFNNGQIKLLKEPKFTDGDRKQLARARIVLESKLKKG